MWNDNELAVPVRASTVPVPVLTGTNDELTRIRAKRGINFHEFIGFPGTPGRDKMFPLIAINLPLNVVSHYLP